MISIFNLIKEFKNEKTSIKILNDISFVLPNKGFVLLEGRSGCGKTTLLNILEGLDNDYEGKILIDNKKIKRNKNYIKNNFIIFQETNLLDEMKTIDNIRLILDIKNSNKNFQKVLQNLTNFNILLTKKTRNEELSGGQKQIITLLVGLNTNCKIIFCDEPTGSIDGESELSFLKLLKEASKDKLIVVVSHNIQLYRIYADLVFQIENGRINKI